MKEKVSTVMGVVMPLMLAVLLVMNIFTLLKVNDVQSFINKKNGEWNKDFFPAADDVEYNYAYINREKVKDIYEIPKLLRHVYSLLLIVVGWVIFACDDVSMLLPYLGSMFGANGALGGQDMYWLTTKAILLMVCAIASTQLPEKLFEKATGAMNEKTAFILKAVPTAAVLILSMAFLISDSYNLFLYFRF